MLKSISYIERWYAGQPRNEDCLSDIVGLSRPVAECENNALIKHSPQMPLHAMSDGCVHTYLVC